MAEPEIRVSLAERLKELREHAWPSVTPTQRQLSEAFSTETAVSGATVSAWESATNPKTPSVARLEAYARLFAACRLIDGKPVLVREADLTEEERARYEELKNELLSLLNPTTEVVTAVTTAPAPAATAVTASSLGTTFTFDDGPVTVICSEAPGEQRGPLALEKDPNFTKLQQYGDLDALVEMYGHLRACNPTLDVFHRHAGEVKADDLSSHIILIGGVAWNHVTKRFQDAIRQVPITQVEVPDFPGDIFEITSDAGDDAPPSTRFFPEWGEDDQGNQDLVEDVALIVRLPNPFNGRRTLTMCNGIHSRGVYGAVRSLTDRAVREANEQYLAERFPDGRFALLLRVPVVANNSMSPDVQNPSARLYEWPPRTGEEG